MKRRRSPPAAASDGPRRRGRPPIANKRTHMLRIRCNDEELFKFRVMSKLHGEIGLNAIARDIIIDELNTLISEWPRKDLIATLKDHGLTDPQIHSLLASI